MYIVSKNRGTTDQRLVSILLVRPLWLSALEIDAYDLVRRLETFIIHLFRTHLEYEGKFTMPIYIIPTIRRKGERADN